MRLCIDVDGTICPILQQYQSYADIEPFEGAAQKIKSLREVGHYIIFCTARHMKSCDSNVGLVIARQGHTLLDWLKKHHFEYDELWFGKPYAHIYIDDRALKFNGSWTDITDQLLHPYSLESR